MTDSYSARAELCVFNGLPKTIWDDKVPRVSINFEASEISLANPGGWHLVLKANGKHLVNRLLPGKVPESGASWFSSTLIELRQVGKWKFGDIVEFAITRANNTDWQRRCTLQIVKDP